MAELNRETVIEQFEQIRRELVWIADRILHDRHAAEDCVQNAAMKLCNEWEKLRDGGGGFRQWIRTVLRNEAITLLRQRRRRPTLPADAANLPDPLDPIKTWEDEEYARSVIARYRDTLRPCEAAHLDAVLANDGRFDLSPLTAGIWT